MRVRLIIDKFNELALVRAGGGDHRQTAVSSSERTD